MKGDKLRYYFLNEVFPDLNEIDRESLLSNYSNFTVDEIFVKLTPLFDKYESVKILPSSYIKRIHRFEKEIIHKMNMLNKSELYDSEVLKAIIEVYMDKYTQKVLSPKVERDSIK